GSLRLPALLRMGEPLGAAIGTNVTVGFFVGCAGVVGHVPGGIDWTLLAVAAGASIPGALLGSRLTGRLPEAQLKTAIAVILVVASGEVFAQARGWPSAVSVGAVPTGEELRSLMRLFPAGVSVVGADAHGDRIAVTMGSLISLSLDPPLVGISVGRDLALHELLRTAGGLRVAGLGRAPRALRRRLA